MSPDTRLVIDGLAWGGWKEIEIRLSIESLANSFRLGLTERWGQIAPEPRPISPGAECCVEIDGEPVITGFVDEVSPSFDAQSHGVTVTGRTRTGDLVDCSAVQLPNSWQGAKLEEIVRAIAAPFDVPVTIAADTGPPFKRFPIQQGETAFEAIERACRQRGVRPIADAFGGLQLTQGAGPRAGVTLRQGVNMLRADGSFGIAERFSRYQVKSQDVSAAWNTAADTASPDALALDDGVGRYRPLLVIAEALGDGVTLADRAAWERNVRLGRARRATVTVQGWREAGASGPLWQPRKTVAVESRWLNIAADLVIASVTFTKSETGTTTELELMRAEALDLLPEAGPEEEIGW